MADRILVVATGEKWVGYGTRSFSSVMNEVMTHARKEISMTAYVISDLNITQNIKSALDRGVSAEIFISTSDGLAKSRAVGEIFRLKDEYSGLRVHMIENDILHAKVLVADGYEVLVGSANPTFGGMVKNYEIGLLVDDVAIAQKS